MDTYPDGNVFILSAKQAGEYSADDYDRQASHLGFTEQVCWWWLRSPSIISSIAAVVYDCGMVHVNGHPVDNAGDTGTVPLSPLGTVEMAC